MGNLMSEDAHKGHKEFLRTLKSSPDANLASFRVYIHRRKKFIPAWLRVSLDEIILERSKTDVVIWPLQYLRRYGYTSAGVFFFESGRRCQTGEGLHCFQSHNADAIFQLVQSRIQDNANTTRMATMSNSKNNISEGGFGRAGDALARGERARSSGPSLSLAAMPPRVARISPVQRFGSEGGGIGSESMFGDQQGYNSYHRDRLRNFVIPPPPRPRSVGEAEGHLPSDSFHPHRHHTLVDQRIIGNIVSENTQTIDDSVRPRTDSMSSQQSTFFPNSYVNISPQEVLPSPMRSRLSSTCSSQLSQPATPTRNIFPLSWDAGAGSTNVLCYAQPAPFTRTPSPQMAANGSVDGHGHRLGSYVNFAEVEGRQLFDRDGSSPVNYADVALPVPERERIPSSSPSMDIRNGNSEFDGISVAPPSKVVNYTLIDAHRTRALATANSTADRNGNMRRRNLTNGN